SWMQFSLAGRARNGVRTCKSMLALVYAISGTGVPFFGAVEDGRGVLVAIPGDCAAEALRKADFGLVAEGVASSGDVGQGVLDVAGAGRRIERSLFAVKHLSQDAVGLVK